jgi:uncharacterized protein (DUF1501 family)
MSTFNDRCTECEELELARVHDAVPSQTLPIPDAALQGFPEGRDSGSLTRRRLLQGGVAGFASVYGSRLLGFEEVFESAVAQAAPSASNCLVLVYLAGGNDGLNVVLPGSGLAADQAAYAAARPTIARGVGASTPTQVGSQTMAGTGSTLAWANTVLGTGAGGDTALPGLEALYGDGLGGAGSDLAVLPAVDYVPFSLSHFDSSDYWFAGALSGLTTGWLGRWIDNNGSTTNPLQAVSIDTALSKAIRTADKPVCALPSTSSLGFSMRTNAGFDMPPSGGSNANLNLDMAAFGAVAAAPENVYLGRTRGAYDLAVDVAGAAPTINGQATTAVSYPPNASSLTGKLQLAARLLAAGLGTRIITIHWGSFDTHGSQLAAQDGQLAALAQSLAAFRADLAARGIEQNVTTLAFSEFGRRVDENGSAGTDHGAGGLMMLSGSSVRGGLASEFPGCTPASLSGGNLKVTTDFRSVYQSVLQEWLGGDLTGVIPGGPFAPIQRYDGGNTLFS